MRRPVQILSILVLLASTAAAEPEEAGFGLYLGKIVCRDEGSSNCGSVAGGFGVDGHLRYMFNPKVGVTAEVFYMTQGGDYWGFRQTIGTVGVAFRPNPDVTLTAGLGGAYARAVYKAGWEGKPPLKAAAPALMASASVSMFHTAHSAVALQLRGGMGLYRRDDNGNEMPDIEGKSLGAGVAITWF